MTIPVAVRGAVRGRLDALYRITSSLSFRIVLLFAGFLMLSGALAILLSGLQSQHSLEKQIRRAVRAERTEVISAAGGMDLAHFRPVVQNLVRHEPDFFYLLEDGANRVLAGNMLHLRPQPGSRWLSRAHRQLYGEPESAIYGEGVLLNDGGYFFVGLNARSLTELRHDFWIIVGWSLVGFSVLGVGGGMILSAIILGRIETISVTARRIMSGDMAQRIPYQGADDEFDHLAHSLNAMLERNERLISSLQQVSNDIAHDMRRPLSRLRRRLEAAALAERLPDAARDTIEDALGDLDAALETFSSLLRLSQIEAEISTGTCARVSLDDLTRRITDLYGPVAEDRGQVLIVPGPVPGTVAGDPVLLMQMLSNLVENAINHTPAGSRISLDGRLADGRILLVVADDGPGIPPDARERVFQRFVRLDASRSVPGSGLGLSLVRAIVRLHGGTISLSDNRPGLRCTIILPDDAAAGDSPRSPAA